MEFFQQERGVVQVGDGPSRYFAFEDGGAAAWTVPPDKLDTWLAGLRKRVDPALAVAGSGEDYSPTSGKSSLRKPNVSFAVEVLEEKAGAEEELREGSELAGSVDDKTSPYGGLSSFQHEAPWVVRLDSAYGDLYYENTVDGELSYFDPFEEDNVVSSLFNEQWDHWDETIGELVEHLAGYDSILDRQSSEGGEAEYAVERLENWLDRKHIEVTEADALNMKWPEYADVDRVFDGNQPVHISVNLSDFPVPQNLMTVPVKLSSTVQEVHEYVFSRLSRTDGTFNLDSRWSKQKDNSQVYHDYVYKVIGSTDFLLHQDLQLGCFDHITLCTARRLEINLTLIRLSESDQLDLHELITEPMDDLAKRSIKAANSKQDDDWQLDRDKESNKQQKQRLAFVAWDTDSSFAQSTINWSIRCMVRGISNFPALPEKFDHPKDDRKVCIQFAICNGGRPLPGTLGWKPELDPADWSKKEKKEKVDVDAVDWSKSYQTRPLPFTLTNGVFDQEWPSEWLNTSIKVKNLPLTSRICLRMVLVARGGRCTPVAGASLSLIDFRRKLLSGAVKVYMWPSEELQRALDKDIEDGEAAPQILAPESRPVGGNPEKNAGLLHIIFDRYELPIVAHRPVLRDYFNTGATNGKQLSPLQPSGGGRSPSNFMASPIQKDILRQVIASSPLHRLTAAETDLVYAMREHCLEIAGETPNVIPKLIQAIDWADHKKCEEGRAMLARLSDTLALGDEIVLLELLDVAYPDVVVREFVVRMLDRISDNQLEIVLLQLTQALKYEQEHDSPLARMLLRRAIRNPIRIGQLFFWMLRSEMHVHSINERFGLLLKLYLERCGPHRTILARQLRINEALTDIARAVHHVQSKKKYNEFVQRELRKLQLPTSFSLCHAPKIELTSIVVEKCKVMTSKKLPLRLDFASADPHARGYYRALFKCGDDLRQDLLTLQVLGTMEKMWIEAGLEPRMIPYACCSAGDQLGFIEWVTDSETTAHIQTKYGGRSGALRRTNMRAFLAEHNLGESSTAFNQAVENFIQSCASYCIATYVLGIGDRHSDNIMVKENGMLFHIDFGHFLGNFKKKLGIQRERDPFVFTPDFCFVMGKAGLDRFGNYIDTPEFKTFRQLCCKAYNVLRDNQNLLINLFTLMVPAGMPELTSRFDVAFLEEKLTPGLSNAEAAAECEAEIKKALGTITRRLDNLAHAMKHAA